ncbi:hypothetical protein RIF29_27247 [Crotalaria pallida]|uniref:Tim44-like domain-containing protein n=1 Tax=Crotalaria pallida TaxID=3830 RepID=A0AAN9EQX7_CROPI
MASRKLVRDLLLSNNNRKSLLLPFTSHQASRLRLSSAEYYDYSGGFRGYKVLNEFSKKIKGEAERNPEFEKSVKEFREKTEELKEKFQRTRQKAEDLLSKQADEAEAAAKKVSYTVKEKISSATEEVKETFGIGKEDSSGSTSSSTKQGNGAEQGSHTSPNEEQNQQYGSSTSSEQEQNQQFGSTNTSDSFFGKFKSTISSPHVSAAFQKIKDAKFVDVAKRGYDIVKEELSSNPTRRKRVPFASTGETSTRTELLVVPSKQSWWSKKFDEIKDKVRGHPASKRIAKISEPVTAKGQEIVEDLRDRYETSDNPIIHKIQDLNDSMFQETDAAVSYKEIRQRDPDFSLPEFVAEVQEAVKPVLNAYLEGDDETLKKYCSPELIERFKAERMAYQSHGIFFDHKILHISDVDVRETKMMGASPVIIVVFQTQQIHCVRNRDGAITEGGKDTIQTVLYAWALQQMDHEEQQRGQEAIYLMWRLREMQQHGVLTLI